MPWDVFISHASEDKDAVAVPLAAALEAAGLSVWLDKNQIRSVGIGVRELVAPVPRSQDAMSKNRRVEFRIYKVPVEATEGGGF